MDALSTSGARCARCNFSDPDPDHLCSLADTASAGPASSIPGAADLLEDHGSLALRTPRRAVALPSLIVEEIAIDLLRPDPANPRRIGESELDALERSLRKFGFVQPVLARRQDGTVIGGHQRLIAARRLGLTTVPVIWLDLSIEQSRLLGLALNRISGSWDEQLLARLLADLGSSPAIDLTLSGFGEDEVRELLRSLESREKRERVEYFDLEAALAESTRAPRTKPGQLWALGDHRLLVGDATRPQDVERILAGRRAGMVFTDPPYNVSLGDHGGAGRGARRRRIANDSLDRTEWETFVRGWARTLLAVTDGAIYICMSSKELPLVSRVLAEEGGHWSDTIIWAKDRFVLGRADYQRAYEPIWYGWREGASHNWCGDRDQDDVWQIARPADAPLHPTMKPLALMQRAIANSSRPGELVLDAFLGSGSTLVACERTGRVCAGIELDPIYADVALARWERFGGQRAERIDGAIGPDNQGAPAGRGARW
jgi:DNA modification methylase